LPHIVDKSGKPIASDNPFPVRIEASSVAFTAMPGGSPLVAAGKKIDADDTEDRVITTDGFNTISIINDGPGDLVITIDESSLTGENKIYVECFEGFIENIAGEELHYSALNDICTFRYVLK